MSQEAATKHTLVARALAAAERAHPALDRRRQWLGDAAARAEQCIAAARAWLADGDAAQPRAVEAAGAAKTAVLEAWSQWNEGSGVAKDLVSLTRAIHAVEAAMLAAEAAAWTPARATRGWEHDAAEMRARIAAGPAVEVIEAERCAQLDLGASA